MAPESVLRIKTFRFFHKKGLAKIFLGHFYARTGYL